MTISATPLWVIHSKLSAAITKGDLGGIANANDHLGELLEDEARDAEFRAVIDSLAADYPGIVDYHTEDGELFDLLDKDDSVIATITERDITAVWNAVELG